MQLALALVNGAASDALSAPFLSKIHAPSIFVKDKDWMHGQWSDVFNLSVYYWQRAVSLAPKQPEEAAILAKAGLLISVHQDFESVRPAMRLCRDERYAKVAKLDERQIAELKEFAAQQEQQSEAFRGSERGLQACEAVDVLITAAQGTVNVDDVERALRAIEKLREVSPGYPEDDRWIAELGWMLMAIARDRKSAGARERIEPAIRRWREESLSVESKRWFTEALTMEGKPPRTPHVSKATGAP